MPAKNKHDMSWTLRLGRWMGIDVYLHVTFLLLLGLVGLSHGLAGGGLAAAAGGVVFFACFFACVLLHEYGHALAARHYGVGTRDITLLPIGGVARLERMPDRPAQELVVALAGPLVNVVIAAGLFLGLKLGGWWQPLSTLGATSGNMFERLLVANVFLVLFNLLPAFPMDGGRVLRAVLAMKLPHARATRLAAWVGQAMAVIFGVTGLFGNPMLLLIAVFVWLGAAKEAAAAEVQASFQGAVAQDAMLTDFKTLAPGDTLRRTAQMLLAGSQQDFPVAEQGAVVGMVSANELLAALRERDDQTSVGDVMRRDFAQLSVLDPLNSMFTPEHLGKGLATPVLQGGRLVGLITAENVGEFFMIRSALETRSRLGGPPATPGPFPPVLRLPMDKTVAS